MKEHPQKLHSQLFKVAYWNKRWYYVILFKLSSSILPLEHTSQ